MLLTNPGVYREEVRRDLRVLPALSTANLALVGAFSKGPVGQPTFVASDAEFKRIFGDFTALSRAPLAWAAYALNGGQFGYILRLAPSDAETAVASFAKAAAPVTLATASGGGPVAVNLAAGPSPLNSLPIKPGTVTIQIADVKQVSLFNTGVTYAIAATSVNLTLGNRLVVPGSFSTTIDGDSYTDDGAGGIEQGVTPSGTIDYETGAVSITLTGPSATAGSVIVGYQYNLSSKVSGEVAAQAVAGATVYHGKVANGDLLTSADNDFMVFSWTDAGDVARTAEVDDLGAVTGDATGTVDLASGEWTLFLGVNTVKVGTAISVSYWHNRYMTATDDGLGGFINGTVPALNLAQPRAINYETGAISFTTNTVALTGSPVRAFYSQAVQAMEARDPGASGDDLRVQITPVNSSLNRLTGQYALFNVSVQEENAGDANFTQVWATTNAVNLDDVANARHIAQVVNDDITGAQIVSMAIPADDAIPDGLQGATDTQDLGDGTGAAVEILSQLYLFDGRIVPGSVRIAYTSGGVARSIVDNNLGGLTGDVDGGSTASIDYTTGVLQFTPDQAPDNSTAVEVTFAYLPLTSLATTDFEGGEDGSALSTSDVVGPTLSAIDGGIYGLNKIEEIPLILAIPDFAGVVAVEREAIAYAEQRFDTIVLCSPPAGVTRDQAIEYRLSALASNSSRAVMYWPWIKVRDPLSGATVTVPPHGHVAGVWAKTDQVEGIQQAPAGTVFGRLQFIEGVERVVSKVDLGLLSQVGINSLYRPPRQPLVVYDCLTQSDNIDFRFLNVRRVKDYLDILVAEALGDLVFRNLGPTLWSIATQRIRTVLSQAFRNGQLRGTSEAQAFEIKVDGENNPPAVEEAGELVCDWGISPGRPGRFIRSRSRILAVQ
jgi:phage tail sheath protein FI